MLLFYSIIVCSTDGAISTFVSLALHYILIYYTSRQRSSNNNYRLCLHVDYIFPHVRPKWQRFYFILPIIHQCPYNAKFIQPSLVIPNFCSPTFAFRVAGRSMGELTEEKRKKIIIDTDPGIDDAMAIFLAFQSPEVDVIGLTTIFGNVYTSLATKNALHLLEVVGREDIPVAEGSHTSIKRVPKLRIADFVHGSDGLGNTSITPPKGNAIVQSAAEFLVEKANQHPEEVTVVALGPLTNIALAIEMDPLFSQKIGQIVILGGAFSMNGNVNPAAEANIFGDPEAADRVFTCGADIIIVGINVTHQVVMTDKDLEDLTRSHGKYAKYLSKILKVYFEYHLEAYNTCGVYLHDPTAMFAAINPSLMTYVEGVVRVQSEGIFRGVTVLDNMKKRWGEVTEWSNKPSVKVAMTVDADQVVLLLMDRLKNS